MQSMLTPPAQALTPGISRGSLEKNPKSPGLT